jgi:hypothetical protein
MPLCPQITNTPVTVSQTGDFTVTSVVPLIADSTDGLANNIESIEILADGKTKVYRQAAEPTGAGINNGDLWIDTDDGNKLYVRAGGVWVSAQDGAIGTAQTTANNAATAAGTAQSTANTALANAATAFNAAVASLQPSANTIVNAQNQMTAINGGGITVYSGASPTTGARVVLNSAGLAAFNASNVATFSLTASTGAAVFAGSVTGATITGGTLNINGNAIIDGTGLLTATGATITGTINATAGYFGTASNGYSISSAGLTSVGTTAITGGTIQTSTGSNAVILNGSANALQIKANTSVVSNMLNFSTSGTIWHHGSTADSTGATYPQARLTSSSMTIYGGASAYFAAAAAGNTVEGATTYSGGTHTFSNTLTASSTFNANSDVFMPNLTTTASAANMRVGTGAAGEVFESTASSQRFKENIVNLTTVFDLDPKQLLDLPVRAFTYKDSYLPTTDDRSGAMIPGFIAEEVDSIYPIAADYDQEGPHNWNEKMIVPGLLALIQEIYTRVEALEGE